MPLRRPQKLRIAALRRDHRCLCASLATGGRVSVSRCLRVSGRDTRPLPSQPSPDLVPARSWSQSPGRGCRVASAFLVLAERFTHITTPVCFIYHRLHCKDAIRHLRQHQRRSRRGHGVTDRQRSKRRFGVPGAAGRVANTRKVSDFSGSRTHTEHSSSARGAGGATGLNPGVG